MSDLESILKMTKRLGVDLKPASEKISERIAVVNEPVKIKKRVKTVKKDYEQMFEQWVDEKSKFIELNEFVLYVNDKKHLTQVYLKENIKPNAEVQRHGLRTTEKMNKPLLTNDSWCYSVELDPFYDYYRFLLKLGCEDNFNDINKNRIYPMLSFYTVQERDRFIEICKKNGVKFKQISGEDREDKITNIKSPVPSAAYRDVKI